MSVGTKIKALVAEFIAECETVENINNGLCADFANVLAERVPSSEIHGVYDPEDIDYCPGNHSAAFFESIEMGEIAHTALYLDGRFYDAEAPAGVELFEHLPVCRRAMGV